jgi:predicted nuclease of predicted toxin-antitoxin system
MVLITADLDFGYLLAYTKNRKPSVIVFRLKKPLPEYINHLLSLYLNDLIKSLEEGSIVIIDDNKIRIRRLPI